MGRNFIIYKGKKYEINEGKVKKYIPKIPKITEIEVAKLKEVINIKEEER